MSTGSTGWEKNQRSVSTWLSVRTSVYEAQMRSDIFLLVKEILKQRANRVGECFE